MQIRSSFKRLRAAGLETPAEFRLHAKRQKALILEATAKQERAKARHLNLAVARQAALLIAAIAVAIGTVIGLLGQPEVVSIGFWR